MLRRLAIALVAVGTAIAFAPAAGASLGASTLTTTAASVALAPESTNLTESTLDAACADTFLCFWVHADYLGQKGRLAGNNDHWSAFDQGTCPDNTWNDCASSAKNRGLSCTVHLYEHSHRGGAHHSIGRGGNRAHLSAVGFNDRVSSNYWC